MKGKLLEETFVVLMEEEGKLLREFLRNKGITKRGLTSIKFEGGILQVNGVEVNVRTKLKEHDVVTVVYPPEKRGDTLIGENIPLRILYEDAYVLVVHKPAHMNSIPSREHPTGSLAQAVIHYYESIGLPSTIHIVTRLDRDTSGALLIAKYGKVHEVLRYQQQAKKVQRTYEAVLHGNISSLEGSVNLPIGRKDGSIIERTVRSDGRSAVTNYEVLQSLAEMTHVKVQLETGRTHQIRVHFAHIGHPLVGDTLYGGAETGISRQALHCRTVQWEDFVTGEQKQVVCPVEEDIAALLSTHSVS